MKRYLGITEETERCLKELGPRIEKHLPQMAEHFYLQIPRHAGAFRVISGGSTQIERLKQTLIVWAHGLFGGVYDEAYAAERFRIGYRHVHISLDQRYVISAMSTIRSFLIDCVLEEYPDPVDRRMYARALSRILDLDLNLICESYMRATLESLRKLNSELESVNQRLEQASRTKDIFLSHVSHELRTPLNSILGFTKLILDGLCSNAEEEREWLRDVFSSARHLLDLVNDILDIRRVEEGKLSLRIENLNLQRLIASTLPLITIQAVEKGLHLRNETIGKDLPVAWADEMRVRQVLLNLLNNAVKFTATGSITLRVGLEACASPDLPRGQNMVRIEVEDTGSGIPSGEREKVFDEFVQLGDHSTLKQRGAGLGLAISRRLISLMGGVIALEAGRNGRGTLAWFTLPLAQSSSHPDAADGEGRS